MLITSCKLPPSKNEMMAPEAHNDQEPFTNPPSGNLAFQSRLADASLFSGYKEDNLKARKTGQRQRLRDDGVMAQPARCWHGHSFYCSRCILNWPALEERLFNSWVYTLSLSSRQQSSKGFRDALCSQWHRDKSRWSQSNRLSRRGAVVFHKGQGQVLNTPNVF